MGRNAVVHPAVNVGCAMCCRRSWSLGAGIRLPGRVGGIGGWEMGCFGGSGSAMLQRMGVAW
jgi:hypothetical protein